MICKLEMYSRKGDEIVRQNYLLPNITVEEFDPKLHICKIFEWGDGDIKQPDFPHNGDNLIYIWRTAMPETDEEKKRLIDSGKWGYVKVKEIEAK